MSEKQSSGYHIHNNFTRHSIAIKHHEKYFLNEKKYCVICEKILNRTQTKVCSLGCRGKLSSLKLKGKKYSDEHNKKLD